MENMSLNKKMVEECLYQNGCKMQEAIDEVRNELAMDEYARKIREEMEYEKSVNDLVKECLDQNPDLENEKRYLRALLQRNGYDTQKAIDEVRNELATESIEEYEARHEYEEYLDETTPDSYYW